VTTVAAGGLSTTQLADRLGVTFRQLDHLARSTWLQSQLAPGGAGHGRERIWPPDVIARLEIATAFSGVLPWGAAARTLLAGPTRPADAEWVLVRAINGRHTGVHGHGLPGADLGEVRYAATSFELVAALERGDGGLVARIPSTIAEV
jgi:hypothetical protein